MATRGEPRTEPDESATRNARALLGASILLCSFGTLAGCGRNDPAPMARGAIVYLVDTLRADHLGCYGYERATSPNIDALAAEGLRFERCMAQSSWTKPSTASVLTGLYPSEHGATKEASTMPQSVVTLAERVSAAGVRTAGFFANSWLGPRHQLGQGFETWEHIEREEEFRTLEATRRGLEFLDGLADDERFLLYLHVVDPHAPYAPPAPWDRHFGADYTGEIEGDYGLQDGNSLSALDTAGRQRLIDLYDSEIAYTDHLFGAFVDGLEERDLLDETLLVFVADHGEEFGEHQGWRHNALLFDQVVRVPLIVRFPASAGAARGAVSGALARQIDIAPTVLFSLGLAGGEELAGQNLLELAGATSSDPGTYSLTESDTGGMFRKAVVTDDTKYVRSWAPTQGEYLYDLAEDPGELRDIGAQEPERLDLHRGLLDRILERTSDGVFLLFQNGGDEYVEAECFVLTDVDFPRVIGLYTEEMGGMRAHRDGFPQQAEVEWEGERRKGTRMLMQVAPGDGDGIRIEPAEGERSLELGVRIDGVVLEPEFVLLGAGGEPATESPYRLELGDLDALAAPIFPARDPAGGFEQRIRIWTGAAGGTEEAIEFTPEEIEAFQAIGYMGGE